MQEIGDHNYPVTADSALAHIDAIGAENSGLHTGNPSTGRDSSAPSTARDVVVVGGIWLKETGICAPILGLRIHEKLYFGFKAKQRFGKSPDYHIFEHIPAGSMQEVGCLWVTNTMPGKTTKDGEKLLIRFGDEYLFAVRPAPIVQKKQDGSVTVKAPSTKEPTFLILAVAPTSDVVAVNQVNNKY